MLTLLRRVDAVVAAACRLVLYLTTTAIFLILTSNVFLRYGAGSSLSWASELPELLFPWLIMSGVIIAAQHGSHIAVVIVTQKLPEPARRGVIVTGALAVIACYWGLAWMGWPLIEIAADELSPMLQVPGSYTVSCLVGGFFLIGLVTLIRLPLFWNGLPAGGHLE